LCLLIEGAEDEAARWSSRGYPRLLKDLTNRWVERALKDELTAHIGYDEQDAKGRRQRAFAQRLMPRQIRM
jgi:transposase-like protein